jgi:hypothetical protein
MTRSVLTDSYARAVLLNPFEHSLAIIHRSAKSSIPLGCGQTNAVRLSYFPRLHPVDQQVSRGSRGFWWNFISEMCDPAAPRVLEPKWKPPKFFKEIRSTIAQTNVGAAFP